MTAAKQTVVNGVYVSSDILLKNGNFIYFVDQNNVGGLLLWIICVFFVSCVSHAFASVHCCLVVTCWEKVVLLALVDDFYCIFVTLRCGILGQV